MYDWAKQPGLSDDVKSLAAEYPTMISAWDNCLRAGVMIEILTKLNVAVPGDRRYSNFAAWCVKNTPLGDGRFVSHLLDGSARQMLRVAEYYMDGTGTEDDVISAISACVVPPTDRPEFYAATRSAIWAAESSVSLYKDMHAIYAAGKAAEAVRASAVTRRSLNTFLAVVKARRAQADYLRNLFLEDVMRASSRIESKGTE